MQKSATDQRAAGVDRQRQLRSSAVGKELSLLTPRHRQDLHIADEAILIWDVIVCLVAGLLDETDERSWTDRAESALEGVLGSNFLSEESITSKGLASNYIDVVRGRRWCAA